MNKSILDRLELLELKVHKLENENKELKDKVKYYVDTEKKLNELELYADSNSDWCGANRSRIIDIEDMIGIDNKDEKNK